MRQLPGAGDEEKWPWPFPSATAKPLPFSPEKTFLLPLLCDCGSYSTHLTHARLSPFPAARLQVSSGLYAEASLCVVSWLWLHVKIQFSLFYSLRDQGLFGDRRCI